MYTCVVFFYLQVYTAYTTLLAYLQFQMFALNDIHVVKADALLCIYLTKPRPAVGEVENLQNGILPIVSTKSGAH